MVKISTERMSELAREAAIPFCECGCGLPIRGVRQFMMLIMKEVMKEMEKPNESMDGRS